MIQALHPAAMAGVAGHSSYQRDLWGRLNRTRDFVLTMVYGDVLLPPFVLALYGREQPRLPASVLQVSVRLGAMVARAAGKPPPVLRAARERAGARGLRL
jgi:hydrogenase/urease accessory protein HupE